MTVSPPSYCEKCFFSSPTLEQSVKRVDGMSMSSSSRNLAEMVKESKESTPRFSNAASSTSSDMSTSVSSAMIFMTLAVTPLLACLTTLTFAGFAAGLEVLIGLGAALTGAEAMALEGAVLAIDFAAGVVLTPAGGIIML